MGSGMVPELETVTQNLAEANGESPLAGVILDRPVHNEHRLVLKGDSVRKRQALNTTDVNS